MPVAPASMRFNRSMLAGGWDIVQGLGRGMAGDRVLVVTVEGTVE